MMYNTLHGTAFDRPLKIKSRMRAMISFSGDHFLHPITSGFCFPMFGVIVGDLVLFWEDSDVL